MQKGSLLNVAPPSSYDPHSWLANFAWNTWGALPPYIAPLRLRMIACPTLV